MKKNNSDLVLVAVVSVLLVILGGSFVAMYIILPNDYADETLNKIAVWGGTVIFVLGCFFFLYALSKLVGQRIAKKASREAFAKLQTEMLRQKQEKERKIPVGTAFQTTVVGAKQPMNEKFKEIAKMDKSQFSFYVARLFALKGYGIKFTPVVDNFGIDLLVERDEKVFGVACFISDTTLSDENLSVLQESRSRYRMDGIFAVTNNFFNRSALEFAKRGKITLVDKNVLAEEYMK